jgi:hypothetical protein
MDKRILLGCSVALNVLLVGWLVFWRHAGDPLDGQWQLPTSKATFATQDTAADFLGIAELRRLREQLDVSGVGQDIAKTVIVARVQVDSSMAAGAFWEPSYLQSAKQELARFERQQRAEQALVALFGSQAEQDAQFAEIFAPLRKEFPFLAPAKQRGLQRLVAESNRELVALTIGPGLASKRSRVLAKLAGDIEALLGPLDFREYQLRRSGISQQLRALEFRFGEDEFRRIFSVHADALPGSGHVLSRIAPNASDKTSTQIREILGEQRFRQYEMIQDPRYQIISALAAQFAVPDANVEKVYALLREADSQAEALQKQSPVMSLDARTKWLVAERAKSVKLRALLGEQAYAAGSAMLNAGVHNLASSNTSYSSSSARTRVPLRTPE